MTDKQLKRTTDLGSGWFANEWSDGSMTVRNGEKGVRIDLPKDSVETLRRIFRETATA
jgi:hypothetical protein